VELEKRCAARLSPDKRKPNIPNVCFSFHFCSSPSFVRRPHLARRIIAVCSIQSCSTCDRPVTSQRTFAKRSNNQFASCSVTNLRTSLPSSSHHLIHAYSSLIGSIGVRQLRTIVLSFLTLPTVTDPAKVSSIRSPLDYSPSGSCGVRKRRK
jgi:hypothetical protein